MYVKTGIVVVRKTFEGPYVLLRAEMDGLPIVEQKTVFFKFKDELIEVAGKLFFDLLARIG